MAGTTTTQPAANTAEAHYEARRLVKMKELRNAVDALKIERDTARTERDKAVKELETVKTKSDSSSLAKQNQELQQRLRVLEHRKTLDKIAIDKGLNPDAVDAFFKLSEYNAEGDEVNADEVAAFVDGKKAEHPYLFQPPADGTPAPVRKPAPGQGQGTGKSKQAPAGDRDIIREGDPRLSDPVFQMLHYDKMVLSAQTRIDRGELSESRYDGQGNLMGGLDGRQVH